MAEKFGSFDPLRPAVPQVKWWIVGAVFVLLGAWQLAVHRWFMDLPMVTGHRLSALVGAGIVVLAVLAFLGLIQRYEDRMAAGTKILWEVDQGLRQRAAERNARFLEVARELEELGKEIARECEGALQQPTADGPARAPAAMRGRADAVTRLACSIKRLVDEADASANLLPRALEAYRCHCAAGSEAASDPRDGTSRSGADQQTDACTPRGGIP